MPANNKPKGKVKKLLTPTSYICTKEHAEFCKQNREAIRKKLPVHYSKPLQEILLEQGFDYPAEYIRSVIRAKSHYNINVFKAAIIYIKKLGDGNQIVEQQTGTAKRGKDLKIKVPVVAK